MGNTLAKIYVVLSGAIVVVGVVGFFRHEMFNFIHLGVGLLSLAAGLASAKPS